MFDDTNIQTQFPLAVLRPQKEPRNYTLSEYLRREEKLDRLNEYYDGIIKKLPMANGTHNLIATNMSTALNIILSLKNNNHIVLGGKQLVYLPMLNWGVYPDVLTVIDTPQYFDTDETLLINPLIIIEVLAKNIVQNVVEVLNLDDVGPLFIPF